MRNLHHVNRCRELCKSIICEQSIINHKEDFKKLRFAVPESLSKGGWKEWKSAKISIIAFLKRNKRCLASQVFGDL